jgi:hypothetical protein
MGQVLDSAHQAWIQSDSEVDVPYDLMRMCLKHLFVEVILLQKLHIVTPYDRDTHAGKKG